MKSHIPLHAVTYRYMSLLAVTGGGARGARDPTPPEHRAQPGAAASAGIGVNRSCCVSWDWREQELLRHTASAGIGVKQELRSATAARQLEQAGAFCPSPCVLRPWCSLDFVASLCCGSLMAQVRVNDAVTNSRSTTSRDERDSVGWNLGIITRASKCAERFAHNPRPICACERRVGDPIRLTRRTRSTYYYTSSARDAKCKSDRSQKHTFVQRRAR